MGVVYIDRHIRQVQVIICSEGHMLHCLVWPGEGGWVADIHSAENSGFHPMFERVYFPENEEIIQLGRHIYVLR